jgi:hypothetical protein
MMTEQSLKFHVKYLMRDYWHAVKIKMGIAQQQLKSSDQKLAYWLFSLIKPFIIVYLLTKAKLTKLRHDYRFELNDQFSRSFNDTSDTVSWNRFSSYTETEQAILLNLDINQGNDGQVLIPKRVLTDSQLNELFNLLHSNEVLAGDIELNVDLNPTS